MCIVKTKQSVGLVHVMLKVYNKSDDNFIFKHSFLVLHASKNQPCTWLKEKRFASSLLIILQRSFPKIYHFNHLNSP